MVASCTNMCAQCAAEIEAGQRWVREKVYEPALAGREPRYRRYHVETLQRTRTELLGKTSATTRQR
jgi:hypothetical protein